MTIRIEIHEQPERKRFWAEVEVGGMIARRREVVNPRDAGLAAMLSVVQATVDEMIPRPNPDFSVPPTSIADAFAKGDAMAAAGLLPPDDAPRAALRAEAEALGIEVDGRWGETRLRVEIAAAGSDKAPENASEVGAAAEGA